MGSLCVIGVFLITYQGKGQLDAWLSTLAGFAALGIAFFPTADVNSNSVSHLNAQLHFVSAGVFFSLLAIFCLFLFPNAPRFMTFDQRDQYACRRDRVYRGCGYTIVVCLLLIGLVRLMPHWFASFKPVFILEWLALAAFGVSWIVAGKYWRFSYLVSPNEGYRIVK